MRTKPLLVLLVALAALTVFVTTAAAAPGPRPRYLRPTTTVEKPIPAADIVVKTAAMLGGSAYPWVQPMWQTVDGVVVVTVPQKTVAISTQPSPWVLFR
jgi:hypothetical protein